MSKIKKTLRFLFFFVLALIIIINAFILISGRTYLYKGIYLTYLSGVSGPTIYDLDKFPKRKVARAGDKSNGKNLHTTLLKHRFLILNRTMKN